MRPSVDRGIESLLATIGYWLLICVPIGFVGYLVTTFLFAFSGSQGRMVPIVNTAMLVVDAVVLIAALLALARTRSMHTTLLTVLYATLVAWLIAIVVEWILSFRFGTPSVTS